MKLLKNSVYKIKLKNIDVYFGISTRIPESLIIFNFILIFLKLMNVLVYNIKLKLTNYENH
jgi:hypothetical protein